MNSSKSKPQQKKKLSEFTEEDEGYFCEHCGKSVSEEEYERNSGYCDECEDDMLTEEFEEEIFE